MAQNQEEDVPLSLPALCDDVLGVLASFLPIRSIASFGSTCKALRSVVGSMVVSPGGLGSRIVLSALRRDVPHMDAIIRRGGCLCTAWACLQDGGFERNQVDRHALDDWRFALYVDGVYVPCEDEGGGRDQRREAGFIDLQPTARMDAGTIIVGSDPTLRRFQVRATHLPSGMSLMVADSSLAQPPRESDHYDAAVEYEYGTAMTDDERQMFTELLGESTDTELNDEDALVIAVIRRCTSEYLRVPIGLTRDDYDAEDDVDAAFARLDVGCYCYKKERENVEGLELKSVNWGIESAYAGGDWAFEAVDEKSLADFLDVMLRLARWQPRWRE
jgi:hypothetical protein